MMRFLLLLTFMSVTVMMVSSYKIRRARDVQNNVTVYCATASCALCDTSNTDMTSLDTQLGNNGITLIQQPIDSLDLTTLDIGEELETLTDCTMSKARCFKQGDLEDDFDVADIDELKEDLEQVYSVTLT